MPTDLSTHTVPLSAIIVTLQGLLMAVILPSIWALIRKLGYITSQLNGIMQWKVDHELQAAKEAALLETTRKEVAAVQIQLLDSLHHRIDDLKERLENKRE